MRKKPEVPEVLGCFHGRSCCNQLSTKQGQPGRCESHQLPVLKIWALKARPVIGLAQGQRGCMIRMCPRAPTLLWSVLRFSAILFRHHSDQNGRCDSPANRCDRHVPGLLEAPGVARKLGVIRVWKHHGILISSVLIFYVNKNVEKNHNVLSVLCKTPCL